LTLSLGGLEAYCLTFEDLHLPRVTAEWLQKPDLLKVSTKTGTADRCRAPTENSFPS